LGLDIFGRGVNIVTCMLPWQREKNRRAGRLTLREKERDWEKGSGIEGYRERGREGESFGVHLRSMCYIVKRHYKECIHVHGKKPPTEGWGDPLTRERNGRSIGGGGTGERWANAPWDSASVSRDCDGTDWRIRKKGVRRGQTEKKRETHYTGQNTIQDTRTSPQATYL